MKVASIFILCCGTLLVASTDIWADATTQPADQRFQMGSSASGGFTLTFFSATATSQKDVGQKESLHEIHLWWKLQSPPDAKIAGLWNHLDVLEAEDEKGRNLLVDEQAVVTQSIQDTGGIALSGQANVFVIAAVASHFMPATIHRLRGRVRVLLVKKESSNDFSAKPSVEFSELTPGVQIKITEIKGQGGIVRVKALYKGREAESNKSDERPPYFHSASLLDQNGKAMRPHVQLRIPTRPAKSDSGSTEAIYFRESDQIPTTLRVRVVEATEEKTLEFVFQDLELPKR